MIKFLKRRGQAAVEFALILPIFALLLPAMIYLGFFILDYVTPDAAAGYAARYVAVHGENSNFQANVKDKVQNTLLYLNRYEIDAASPKRYAETNNKIVTYMINEFANGIIDRRTLRKVFISN
ncbi:MAG: pilus assembly protein [Selenomonadaceae bacterium]|nr:pilus assembly protein [Selenomonadaceae bacterium]